MYNAHRGMGPPGPAPGTRLAELLEQVRAEFETQAGRSNEHEHQRKHPVYLARGGRLGCKGTRARAEHDWCRARRLALRRWAAALT